MSNDPVRVTFPDGRVLYGVGDSSELVSRRLYPTQNEAMSAYIDKTIYAPIAPDYALAREICEQCDAGANDVLLETTYGSLDWSWKEMLAQFARANFTARLITRLPSVEPPNDDHRHW